MKGIFYKANEDYQEKLNPVRDEVRLLTHYIKTTRGVPTDIAQDVAKKLIRKHIKDPEMTYFGKDENEDRIVERGTLMQYINDNISNNRVIAPTLTTYKPRSEEVSVLSEYTAKNSEDRAVIKNQMHVSKAKGDDVLTEQLDNKQNSKKIDNNSLSGIFSQASCVLHNPTAHSTLTSITRIITSLSNAANEMLISGNRYLPRPLDLINHVVYLSSNCDEVVMKEFMSTYGLRYLSVEDVVSILRYSTDLYFREPKYYQEKIIPFLEKLSPEQLTFIAYVSDFYHIRQYNDGFMCKLVDDLSVKIVVTEPLEDPSIVYKLDGAILAYAHTVFSEEVRGYGTDYERMNKGGLANSIYQTSKKLMEVLEKYKLFFNVIIMHDVFPTNSFRLRNMLRRTVVLSDTDSTCCTLDEWVEWQQGQFEVNPKSIALSGLLAFVATQSIVHKLAIFSKRMGVDDSLLKVLQMKNEWLWTVHVPTNISKHYFALAIYQEGNVFAEPELERKGVHLRSSALPVSIMNDAKEKMLWILNEVHSNRKIKLMDLVRHIVNIENEIIEHVRRGDSAYLRRTRVKDAEAYSLGPDRSPYQRHTFWNRTFGVKYQPAEEPPYGVIKYPTTLTNKTKLREWVETMEEPLRTNMVKWLEDHGKNTLPTIYVGQSYAEGYGTPPEIMAIVDVKKIVLDTTITHRILLESLGVMLDEELLVQEQFNLEV